MKKILARILVLTLLAALLASTVVCALAGDPYTPHNPDGTTSDRWKKRDVKLPNPIPMRPTYPALTEKPQQL